MLHGTCTMADCYFMQMLTLVNRGYRVVSVRRNGQAEAFCVLRALRCASAA